MRHKSNDQKRIKSIRLVLNKFKDYLDLRINKTKKGIPKYVGPIYEEFFTLK